MMRHGQVDIPLFCSSERVYFCIPTPCLFIMLQLCIHGEHCQLFSMHADMPDLPRTHTTPPRHTRRSV